MARSNNSSRKRTQRDYTLVFKLGVITTRFSQGFFSLRYFAYLVFVNQLNFIHFTVN